MSQLPTIVVSGSFRNGQEYIRILRAGGDLRELGLVVGSNYMERLRGLGQGREVIILGPAEMYSSFSRYFEMIQYLRAVGVVITFDDMDRVLNVTG